MDLRHVYRGVVILFLIFLIYRVIVEYQTQYHFMEPKVAMRTMHGDITPFAGIGTSTGWKDGSEQVSDRLRSRLLA